MNTPDILPLVERIGEEPTAALIGLVTGAVFGVSAQRSRFCLRAATVSFARGMWDDKLAVWLLTFSTALVWVQAATLLGLFRPEEARMMSVLGSYSGAILGGLTFGVGMVLARGCSGRLLVLAATGNLGSVVSGLIFAVVAQMSLHGYLAPIRDWLAGLWVTPGGRNINLLDAFSLPEWSGLALGLIAAVVALVVARKNRIGAALRVRSGGWICGGLGLGSDLHLEPSGVRACLDRFGNVHRSFSIDTHVRSRQFEHIGVRRGAGAGGFPWVFRSVFACGRVQVSGV